ncbi:outer membrane family protein [Helicobacter sp. 23-1045]
MRIFVALCFALFALNAESSIDSASAESNPAPNPAESIEVLESKPLDDELSSGDVQRFIQEGLVDKENAKDWVSKNDDDDENALVNIYKKITKNAESGDKNAESTAESTAKNAESDDEIPSLIENVYGHIGFFGKTSANQSVGEHFLNFSGSAGLRYDFKEMVFLDLGVFGLVDLVGTRKIRTYALPNSNFVLHRANVKYIAKDEFQNEVFDITAGRFQIRRDWIRNFAQGVSVNANYEWFSVWMDWVDEMARAFREQMSDFNIFKTRYDDRWLIATGLGASVVGVNVAPYYYYFHNNLWAAGGKINYDINFADKKWQSVSNAHFAYAKNKRDFDATSNRNESQMLWLEQVFRWRGEDKRVSFGVGYVRIFGGAFELANVGNSSRFEDYNTQGYGIIGAGGIANGGNSSNMFFAETQSFYGFVGFRIDNWTMMFLGRNSQGKNSYDLLNDSTINQHQYALGARWRIVEGLYFGGVGAYMMENKVNKSYFKGYLEFRI